MHSAVTPAVPRLGMVGLGGYGRVHLTHLQTLHEAGLCQLVAAADPFAAQHGEVSSALRASGIVVRDSLEELLEKDAVDAVFLATPISLHAKQSIAALEAGKHVYLEKPPCATLGEWDAMRAAQERARRRCVVGFQMQSHAAMRFLRRALAEEAIGPLRRVWGAVRWQRTDAYYARSPWAARWHHEGQPVFDGPATNALAHVVQGALSLASASPDAMPQLAKVRGTLKRARPVESYDSIFLEALTTDDIAIRLAFTHATTHHDEVMISCEGEAGRASLTWNGEVELQRGDQTEALRFPCEAGMGAFLDFLRAIKDDTHLPSVTLQDTYPYLQLVNGALQSSGSVTAFEPSQVEHIAANAGDSFYRVARLEDELDAFRADFHAAPDLLSAKDNIWIPAEQINPMLDLLLTSGTLDHAL